MLSVCVWDWVEERRGKEIGQTWAKECARILFLPSPADKRCQRSQTPRWKGYNKVKTTAETNQTETTTTTTKPFFFLSLLSFFSMVPYEMKMYVLAGEGASFLPKNESTIFELLLPSLAYERGGPGKIDLAKTLAKKKMKKKYWKVTRDRDRPIIPMLIRLLFDSSSSCCPCLCTCNRLRLM